LGWGSGNADPAFVVVPAEVTMFFFFSNGLGIIGSIVISVIVTLLLLKACSL
jgi:hypothetical protein